MTLKELNELGIIEARATFELCCGAQRWIDGMLMRKPYGSAEDLQNAGREIWEILSPDDWMEAFSHHPRLTDINLLRVQWPGSDESLEKLKKLNDEYNEKFGCVCIVSPEGQSADEMVGILEKRLPNGADEELKIAAAEQAKITAQRLEKLSK